MTEHLYTYTNPSSNYHLDKVCDYLNAGSLIIYPSDVNWAFACNPRLPKAVSRLKKLKPDHPKSQPFTLLCNSINMISQVAQVESYAYRLLKSILPGPYTLLFNSHKGLPRLIRDKRQTVGVRWPKNELINDLLARLDYPLLTSSLFSKEDKPLSYGYEIFEMYKGKVELILDLGQELSPLETSILSFLSGECEVLRSGEGDVSFLA